MIDLLPLVSPVSGPTPAAPTSGVAAVSLAGGDGMAGATASATTPSFGATFDHFLDARDPAAERSMSPAPFLAPPAAPLPALPREGQEPAADGKKPPAGPSSDDRQPDARADDAPVWFPDVVPQPPVAPAAAAAPAAVTIIPPVQRPAPFALSVERSAGQEPSAPETSPDSTARARTRTTGRFALVATPPAVAEATPPGTSTARRLADRRTAAKDRNSARASDPALATPATATTATLRVDRAGTLEMPVPGQPRSQLGDVQSNAATAMPDVVAGAAPVIVPLEPSRDPRPPALRVPARPSVKAPDRAAAVASVPIAMSRVAAATDLAVSEAPAPGVDAPAPISGPDSTAPAPPTRSVRRSGGVAREASVATTSTSDIATMPGPVPERPGATAPDLPIRATTAKMDGATFVSPSRSPRLPGATTPDTSALVPTLPIAPVAAFADPRPAALVDAGAVIATRGSPRAPEPVVPTSIAGGSVAQAAQPALRTTEQPALTAAPIAWSGSAAAPSIVPSVATPTAPPPSADPGIAPLPVAGDPETPAARSGSAPVPIAAQPHLAITVSATPQPAGRVFAAAFATAAAWRVRAPAHDLAGIAAMAAAPVAVPERVAVSATTDAQGARLDLTRDSGLERMIDRIELLRDAASDAADAGDTRIRLIPDALGSVDIAVRQDGDRVHVRFTAEQEATRALIADAQPRLTDLAAARGVRIGETSVGGGGAQTASGNGSAPQPRLNPQPTRATRSVAPDTTVTTDHRLA